MGDDDQLGLLLLNQTSDVVDAVLEHHGLLGLDRLALSGGSGGGSQALLALSLVLRAVTLAQAEQLGGCG